MEGSLVTFYQRSFPLRISDKCSVSIFSPALPWNSNQSRHRTSLRNDRRLPGIKGHTRDGLSMFWEAVSLMNK